LLCFFFQAEDGIRDRNVTGVQTCALPILVELSCHGGNAVARRLVEACLAAGAVPAGPGEYTRRALLNGKLSLTQAEAVMDLISRSEERRVGKEGREGR